MKSYFSSKNYRLFHVMPCSMVDLAKRFGGSCRLHLQVGREDLAASIFRAEERVFNP
jgi:hypothetical protein